MLKENEYLEYFILFFSVFNILRCDLFYALLSYKIKRPLLPPSFDCLTSFLREEVTQASNRQRLPAVGTFSFPDWFCTLTTLNACSPDLHLPKKVH